MIERVSEKVRRFYRRQPRSNPGLSEREVQGRLRPDESARRTLVFAGVMQRRANPPTGRPQPKEG